MGGAHELHVLGLSFRSAQEEVREGLAFTAAEATELLAVARRELPGVEALVLSTCNRTEFYLAGGDEVAEEWHRVLRVVRPAAPRLDAACDRYHLTGAAAYRHLLRVACGLESALLGDGQVLGQVRQALTLAERAGTLGRVLSPALSGALRAGRQARAETSIGLGAPGVGAAVAEALVLRGIPRTAPVLVLGTGQAARTVTRSLVKAGYRDLRVTGRDATAAEGVARQCGGTVQPWSSRETDAAAVAAVVVATGARKPVLRVPAGPRLVVDAGFPRQVDARGAAPSTEVVSLLALAQQADAAAEARRSAVPEVEALVEAHVTRWERARQQRPLEEAIKHLHAEAAQVAREAAEQLSQQAGLAAADVERLLVPQVRRMLHGHVARLRSLADAAVSAQP